MDFVTEYFKRAEECRVLARRAIIEEHRRIMMNMTYQWETMAVQREAIIQAWRQANGQYKDAAKLLGLHPNSLLRLVRQLGLRQVLK